MKKEKLFIPIPSIGKRGKCVTLLSANKIKELEDVLPTNEALTIHIQMQHLKVEKDSDYEPEPLKIFIGKERYEKIIKKVLAKNPAAERECIPLVLQYPAIPICFVVPKE